MPEPCSLNSLQCNIAHILNVCEHKDSTIYVLLCYFTMPSALWKEIEQYQAAKYRTIHNSKPLQRITFSSSLKGCRDLTVQSKTTKTAVTTCAQQCKNTKVRNTRQYNANTLQFKYKIVQKKVRTHIFATTYYHVAGMQNFAKFLAVLQMAVL